MNPTKRLRSRALSALAATACAAARALAQPPPEAPPAPATEPPATPASEPPVTPGASAPPTAPPAPPTAPPAPPTVAPPYPVPPPGWAAPPAPAPRESPRVGTAHSDRVVLLPTAYTHPEGTLYFSSNEIVLLQAGYALSDTTQVTLTGLPPLGDRDERIYFFDLSLKSAFVRDGPLRLAAIGSVTGLLGIEQGNFVLGRVGAVAEVCLATGCESSASLSSHVLLAGPATFMVNGAGVVWGVGRGAALLLEVDTAVPLGGEMGEAIGVIVVPGFRFPYRTWSLDLAAIRPLDTEEEPDIVALPWVAFTYRFLP